MIASRQVEISFYRGLGPQRGRVFGALAQVIGRTAIPFLRKLIVPAAKRLGVDVLEFDVPEIADVVSARKKQLQRVREDKLWVVLAGNGVPAESFQQNLQNKLVGREETILQTILINNVKQFSVPNFCGSFWKSGRDNPGCWRYLVVPRKRNLCYYLTRWKLHRIWISIGSELLRWFETYTPGFETENYQGSCLRKSK